MTEPDYYKILGITPAAELPEIRQAYRRRVRDAHPDAGGDPEEFHALQQAYENLTDPQLRLEHDAAQGNRRPYWRGDRTPGRHSKSRKVKAWRIKTTVDDIVTTKGGTTDVMARPWFVDIDPQRRLRYAPSVWH
ncbi:MAG: J domain-containing protein, partial [Stackebrandtia sp.]